MDEKFGEGSKIFVSVFLFALVIASVGALMQFRLRDTFI